MLAYKMAASSCGVWVGERSGRPTSPTKSVSPVNTVFGRSGWPKSVMMTQILSRVCPGVCTKRKPHWPKRISSPSLTSTCGKCTPDPLPR